jgi:hypothetical protein
VSRGPRFRAPIGHDVQPLPPCHPRARRRLRRLWLASPSARAAQVVEVGTGWQLYPFGSYNFASLRVPIQLRAGKMVSDKLGVGAFLEGYPVTLEWRLGDGGGATPAYGYNVNAGLALVLF